MPEARPSRRSRAAELGLSLLVGFACSLLLLLVFAPRFWVWPAINIPDLHAYPEVNRAADVLKQLDNPFVDIANPSNRVIEWRLLVPLLASLFGFSRELLFAIAPLGCVVVLAASFHLLRRETGSGWLALGGALIVGSSSWFFISTGWLTYQDSWLVVGALTLVFARSLPALVAACALCPWIDERFLFVLPLLALARWLPADRIDRALRREALAIAAATIPYLLLRLGALLLSSDDQSGAYISDQLAWLTNMPIEERQRLLPGLWQSLRGAWLLVGLWALEPWLVGRRRIGALTAAALLLTLSVNLVASGDPSRSASPLVALALAGLISHARRSRRTTWLVASLALLLGLLTPARHVVVIFEVPIRSLAAELAQADQPPPELDPKARAWRALALEEAGDIEAALSDLEVAAHLDPESAAPLLLRARVLERAGRLREARDAAKAALALAEPGSPTASTIERLLQGLSDAP